MLKIAIIILNWENARATQDCAQSVLQAMNRCITTVNSQLLIVDNGSSDNSVVELKTWIGNTSDTRVTLIENSKNLGFSGGMNSGIFTAMQRDEFDYFWLLNNDLTVEPGSLYSLCKSALENSNVAIWGSTIMDADTNRVQCAGGCRYNRWLGKESRVHAGMKIERLPENKNPKLDYILGAAMLIKGDVLRRLRGLNEDYFLFYEELDLVMQLEQMESIAWCASSAVRHKGGGSSVSKAGRVFTAYSAALSAYKFTWRYYPVCFPTVLISRVLGLAIYAVKNLNPGLALAPVRAFRDFLKSAT